MTIRFSIVGRPNVGKSTLFNRLVGRKQAIVNNQPGVTRDYQVGSPREPNSNFVVVDTAGIDTQPSGELNQDIQKMVESALKQSDAFLFVIDAKEGVIPTEFEIAQHVRKQNKPVIIIANKSESKIHKDLPGEIERFGWGEPHYISAEHGLGFDELQSNIHKLYSRLSEASPQGPLREGILERDRTASLVDEKEPKKALKITVVGRPNAGKSSLINLILGHERVLTGATPGITRDAITISCTWLGTNLLLYDTAGMRKKSKVIDKLEKGAVAEGLRAIRFSEIVIVLFDATAPLESQDLRIADLAEREGRGVLLVANKWDLIEDKALTLKEMKRLFDKSLPQLKGLPIVTISVLEQRGIKTLHKAISDLYQVWNKRIETSELNRWLEMVIAQHLPPAIRGRRIKLRYISQINTRPPSFLVKCNHPESLPASYRRYMVNELRNHYGFHGTPIRLIVRSK